MEWIKKNRKLIDIVILSVIIVSLGWIYINSYFSYHFVITESPGLYTSCIKHPNSEVCNSCQRAGEYLANREGDIIVEGAPSNRRVDAQLCAGCENELIDIEQGNLEELSERCRE